jgi:hypothetical protein
VTFCGYADIVDKLEEGLASMSVAIVERGGGPLATPKRDGPELPLRREEADRGPLAHARGRPQLQARLEEDNSHDGG